MSRNLRGRLERIERLRNSDASGLHPCFWDALCGIFPIDQLDPDTRQLVESLFGDGRDLLDLIEDQLSGTNLDASFIE